MKNMSRLLITSLVLTALAFLPACRSSRKKVEPPKPVAEAPAPTVPAPPAETTIEEPKDFVQETKPVEEVFPNEIEELNRYVQEKGYVRDAFFNYDEATLDAAAQEALGASATWLKSERGAGYKLLVEGHCDERGTEQYNLALGDRRANAAKDYLVTLGVDAARIRTVSYGEERPFAEGQDESSWRQNRRAHLVLVR
jgi:peptidoglycan-associated lipoprotein